MLARLGTWSYRHPRLIVLAWIAIVVAAFAVARAIGPAFNAEFEAPESGSRRGFEALDEHFGGFGSGQSGSIVFRADSGVDDPAIRAAMESMFA